MNHSVVTIKQLYPELTEKELQEAVQNIDDYLHVVVRIHERLEREKQEAVREVAGDGVLTKKTLRFTMPVSKVESYTNSLKQTQ